VKNILVYGDSLSWGIIPGTRMRQPRHLRWPGVLERSLNKHNHGVQVIEDCLNGRRTMLDDPIKQGRNGLSGLAQCIEAHSPLHLVILMLGTNDFQSMHDFSATDSAKGIEALVDCVRSAPIEEGMPVPPILIVSPPPVSLALGTMSEKFLGAAAKFKGVAQVYRAVAQKQDTAFFDAGLITPASLVDGVHLDTPQHLILGERIAEFILAELALF
jgi:lysophospholipase L1-like esterase